jgi:NAD+ synthase (glutamine-hydrolysing)
MARIRVALAQINATVGDFAGNVESIVSCIDEARQQGVDVVAFPELAVCGYPPEDLLLKPSFASANRTAVETIAARTRGITAIIGFAERAVNLHNSAAVLHDGAWAATYRKQRLPNYGVFDELRYFKPGRSELLLELGGATIGLSICEDIWLPGGPVARLAAGGADIIVNINASPFERGKAAARRRMLATRAADHAVVIAYVNLVGGQDELVFDGASRVVDATGNTMAEAAQFAEDMLYCDIELEQVFRARLHHARARAATAPTARSVQRLPLDTPAGRAERAVLPPRSPRAEDDLATVYAALVTGTRDYVRKNGFDTALLGLSGGIDSSLVAAVAVDALGAERVVGVALPSRYSSKGSIEDARALAVNLGIRLIEMGIEPAFDAVLRTLEPPFEGRSYDLAEQNVQARIRGLLLMALSNAWGWLLLTTGNKSEVATGYSTLYGDMAGGFAIIKDVPKLLVYELSEWRNATAGRDLIPRNAIDKPPSAELRPDQRDADSLPEYAVLDPILERYVEQDWSLQELVAAGHDEATVRRVIQLVDSAEYKRRQAAPGIKITPRAFGKDRRLPITSRYRDA